MARRKFEEISKARVKPTRNLVISRISTIERDNAINSEGFIIAQQVELEEGDRKTRMFLKGGHEIDSLEGLYNLRDAINIAIFDEERRLNTEE